LQPAFLPFWSWSLLQSVFWFGPGLEPAAIQGRGFLPFAAKSFLRLLKRERRKGYAVSE
jgi:hypothetical protein